MLPLWRRCRTLANPLRLNMLELLNSNGAQCVKQVTEALGITEDIASKHLHLLATAGFMARAHAGKYLYYTLTQNDDLLDGALTLLCRADTERVIFTVTALTHERRIRILNALRSETLRFEALCGKTGVSPEAMRRHLEKLARRGFVEVEDGKCFLTTSGCSLKERMIQLAMEDFTLAQV